MNWPTWTGAGTKDSCPKKFATNNHTPPHFSIKEAWILTEVRRFSRMSACHLLSLLSFQIRLLFLAPMTHPSPNLLASLVLRRTSFDSVARVHVVHWALLVLKEGWCSDWAEMGRKHHRWGFHGDGILYLTLLSYGNRETAVSMPSRY